MNDLENLEKESTELVAKITETQKAISTQRGELSEIILKLDSPGDPDEIQERNTNLLNQKLVIEGELERMKSILTPLGTLLKGLNLKIEAIRTQGRVAEWNALQNEIYSLCVEYDNKVQELKELREKIIQLSQGGDPFSNSKERDVKGGGWKRPDGISKITLRSREYPEPAKTFLYEKPKNLTPKI